MPAHILETDVLPDDKRRGNIVQLLGDLFAHDLLGLATARADEFLLGRMMLDPFAGEMGWQGYATVAMLP